jgi:hypothetical protein
VDRVLQSVGGPITVTFSVGGTPTDPSPDSATVRVVNDAGVEVVPSTAAFNAGVGVFSYDLTGAPAATLDKLTAYWTVTIGGATRVASTSVEVVGGFLFTITDLKPLVASTVTNDQIARARTRVEQAIERRVGYAFVPRYDKTSFVAYRRGPLRLKPCLRAVRSVTAAGTPYTTAELAGLSFDEYGFLYMGLPGGYSWTVDGERRASTAGPLVVAYEHGLDGPDEETRGAALDWARFLLTQDQSIDSRADRLVTDDGTLVFGGGMSGLPSVDRIIESLRLPSVA